MDRAARHRGRRCALALLLPVLAAAQTLVLEIRAIEGEGAVQPAGARVLAPLSVVVTDETGRPVEGAAVTFRLPEEGAGGVFPNGLKTEVMRTGPDGRATVREIRWNRAPGPVRIRVTAVKDQARAGAIVNQYIAPGALRAAGSGAAVLRGRRRWLKLAVLAGGAAAVGFTAGYAGRSSPRSAAEAAPPVKIGTPVIVIGRP